MNPEKLIDPTQKSSNTPYLVVIVIMVFLSVGGSILIEYLRQDKDNSQLIILIFQTTALITPIILTFIQTRATHKMVNSDLAKWIGAEVQKAFAEGKEAGAVAADARTDMLAEQSKDVPLKE